MTTKSKKNEPLFAKDLVDDAVASCLQKKGEAIMVLNPGNQSGIADWIVICQGDNELHNKAIANEILKNLKVKNTPAWHIEGMEDGRWILLDYTDVVINILLPQLREYYDLEKLWKDCPHVKITESY